jgi:hypothetical protein
VLGELHEEVVDRGCRRQLLYLVAAERVSHLWRFFLGRVELLYL